MLERLSWWKHILSRLVIAHMPASTLVRYMCWPYGAMAMASHLSFSFPSHPIFFFGGGGAVGRLASLLSAFLFGRNSVHIVPITSWHVKIAFPHMTDVHRLVSSISTSAPSKQVKSSHLRMYVSTVSGKIKVISRLREVMLNTKTSEVVYSDVILRC